MLQLCAWTRAGIAVYLVTCARRKGKRKILHGREEVQKKKKRVRWMVAHTDKRDSGAWIVFCFVLLADCSDCALANATINSQSV